MINAATLDARVEQIHAALDLCPQEVPASLSIPAREELDEVSERLALGVDHTVVALFGGTGSGKSSLFNALSHLEFAEVGALRPTTALAAACTWGDDASALLDFLGVDRDKRIRRDSALDGDDEADLAGLVLLDVPDYDSVSAGHALQVDRLVPMADLLVWVVDPQKYADAALHDGYLRELGARQEDIVVLVNQMDTVPSGGEDKLLQDVRTLLEKDGLGQVPVIPVSAVRGDGLKQVRALLLEQVVRESNAARTAWARLDTVARNLDSTVGTQAVELDPQQSSQLTQKLVQSAGVQVVADSINSELGKPLSRPLAHSTAPARAVVVSEEANWLQDAVGKLPTAWQTAVENAVVSPDTMATQTAEAVGTVPLPARRSSGIELLWWVGVLLLLAGLGCGVAVALGAMSGFVLPVLLLIAGIAAMLGAQTLRRRRAQREAESYTEQAQALVASVVERGLTKPATTVLQRHEKLHSALSVD